MRRSRRINTSILQVVLENIRSAINFMKNTFLFLKLPFSEQLRLSVENNFPTLVKLYLNLRLASVKQIDRSFQPILFKPIEREMFKYSSDFSLIKTLCDKGATTDGRFAIDFNLTAPITLYPTLSGNISLLNYLLQKGAILNAVDDSLSTLLMYACGKRFWCSIKNPSEEALEERLLVIEMVKFLLNKGANPYYEDKSGAIALDYTFRYDQSECAQLLINNVPIFYANFSSENLDAFKKLGINLSEAIFVGCEFNSRPLTRYLPLFKNAKIIDTNELMRALKCSENSPVDKHAIIKSCKLYLRANSSKLDQEVINQVKEIMTLAINNTSTLKSACLKFFNNPLNIQLKEKALKSNLPSDLIESIGSGLT